MKIKNFTKSVFAFTTAATLFMLPLISRGQALTGSKTIPGTYASIAAAVTDLNANGVGSGGVTFNISPGYSEILSGTLAVTATGTSANPIVFRKDPSGFGANPLITAHAGTLLASSTTLVDGMWSFTGSDYVTIDGVDLLDPASNTTPTTAMEYGIGFYKASATDGANNNTVKNCTITLNRLNFTTSTASRWAGSVGIELAACNPNTVGTAITQTSVAGASSNNKFYSNTIQNCNGGIAISGAAVAAPYTLADLNNDIGGSSPATGNTIINFGGGASATNACMAVWANNQWSFNISYNTVNNNTGAGANHATTNRGIFAAASSIGAGANINNNIVTIQGGASTSAIDWGIDCEMAQSGASGNTININNNTVTMSKTVASTAAFSGIWVNSAATTVNVNNNVFPSFTYAGTGTSECILSQLSGIGTLNINNNSMSAVALSGATGTYYNIAVTGTVFTALNITGDTINGVTFTGITSKTYRGIYVSTATGSCAISVNNNTFSNYTWSGGTPSGEFDLIYAAGTAAVYNVNSNTLVGSLTCPTSGALYLIYHSQSTPIENVLNNTLCGTGITKTGATGAFYGYYNFGSPVGTETMTGNVWNNITVAGSGAVYGVYFATNVTNVQLFKNNTITNITAGTGLVEGLHFGYGDLGSEISNNIISNITGGAAASGINIVSTSSNSLNIFNNRINNITTTGAAAAIGVSHTAGLLTTMYSNKIYNIIGNNAGATAAGIAVSGATTFTAYNNLIDSIKAPLANAANPVIGINITSATNVNLYYNTVLLEGTSSGALFGSSGVYATTGTNLRMNNNLIINNTVPVGALGYAVAYRRSSTTIGTYSTLSNKNLYYSGISATPNYYIYFDGTNKDSVFGQFQSRVSPREAASASENTTFINKDGSLPNFLQPDSTIATKVESGAANITGITRDFEGNIRHGNAGYSGSGSAPDMGAFEKNLTGIPMVFDSANTDQITIAALVGFTNQAVLRIRVYTENAFSPAGVTKFKFNTAGTTSLANISNAKVFYTGSASSFSATSQFGSVVAAPNGTFYISGNQALSAGANYFWLTYDVAISASNANVIDARVDSVVVGGVNQSFIDGNPAGGTPISAPMAGIYTIGASPYFTLAAAIADLNNKGMTSSVTIKLPAGFIEQAPAGGYLLGSALLNSNLSAGRTLSFVKDGAGSNPLLFANTGTSTTVDGIFTVLGSDYVTINGIDLIDTNTVSVTTQMEQGYSLLKLNSAAPFDGCQHDTIMNVTVTMNRTNVNSKAIYANNVLYNDGSALALTITSPGDANSYNTIIYNTVQNTSSGIVLLGFNAVANPTLYDQYNSVSENTVVNFNGAGSTGYGIYMVNQSYNSIIHNVVDNYNGGAGGAVAGSSTLYGIFNTYSNTSSANPSHVKVSDNFITLTQGSGSSGSSFDIYVYYAHGNTVITNNRLKWASAGASVGTGSLYGVYYYPSGYQITGTTQLIKNNHIDTNTVNNSSGTIYAYYLYGSTITNDYSGNTFTYFSRTGATNGVMYAWYAYYNGNYLAAGTVSNIYNNIIDSVSNGTSTGTFYGYYIGGAYTFNFYNNTITRIATPNAGTVYSLYPYYSTVANVYNNTVSNITGGSTVYGIYLYGVYFQTGNFYNNTITNLTSSASGTLYGIYEPYGGTVALNLYRNTITSLTIPSGSGTVTGMYIGGSYSGAPANMPITVHNNIIGNLTATGATGNPGVIGLRFDYPNSYNYAAGAYYNTINLTGTLGTNGSSAGIYVGSLTPTVKLANNIVVNNTTVTGTGYASAIQRNGAALTTYDITSNNNLLYAGTPSASHVIYNDGTNRDQTIKAYQTRVSPREQVSFTENIAFINGTTPSAANYLQPDSTLATGIESGAATITGITTDYVGNIRQGNAGYTGTGTASDIGAFEGNYIQNDVVAPTFNVTQLGNTASLGDRIVTANIKDNTGVPILSSVPQLYYKKSFAGSYMSATGTRTGGNAKNGTWSFTLSATTLGGLALGDSVYYYIVAQDSSAAANLGSFPGGVAGTDVFNITAEPTPLSYKIVPGIAGTFTVGATGTYTSLTNAGGAFEAINNSALSGNVVLKITSDLLESGSTVLNKWSETGAGNYTLRIVPDTNTERLIVDTATTNNASVIIFNGATRVTVDGRSGGSGKYLRFRNRLASGVAFIFRNDAVRDTIMYCNIECINNTTGTILFGGSTVVGGRGNDSNVVIYNNIGDTLGAIAPAGASNTGISSSGTAGLENDANTIAYNNIYNWGYNALNLNAAGTGNYWTIYDNKIYQTANRTTGPFYVIYIQGGTGHIIRKNSIGGAAPDRSGIPMLTTNSFYGIYQTYNGTIGNTIDSNTIANVNCQAVYGIYISTGVATITDNIIGGLQTPSDSLVATNGSIVGIYTSGIQNITVNRNTVSNLRYAGGSTGYLNGIFAGSYGQVNTVTNNIIHDLYGNGSGAVTNYYHAGIVLYNSTTGGAVSVNNNTIYNIINTSVGAVSGMTIYYAYSPTTISRNKIYNVVGTGGIANGIYGPYYNYNSITFANNQIATSGANSVGMSNGITDPSQYAGTTNSYYNNSIFVNGIAGSTATSNSYGFYRSGPSLDALDIRNNIFYNKRTGGSGLNYAIGYTSVNSINPSTINYNLMVVADTAKLMEMPLATATGLAAYNESFTGAYNTNWTASTAELPAQTLFTDTAAGNLSIAVANANSWYVNGKGIAIAAVTNDFNGNTRSTSIANGATDIGAFEFSTSTTPPAATALAAPALNATTDYVFAGRKVASITWGAAGTVPASVSVLYYTGTTAPSLLASKAQFNSYYSITPTGGTGYTYSIALAYDSARFGNVSSSAATRMARYKSPSWSLITASSANGSTGLMSSGTALAAATLPANFTGTDNTNALPVTIVSIKAAKVKDDVAVSWNTASELNLQVFEVERSLGKNGFEYIGRVEAKGNSAKLLAYSFNDIAVLTNIKSGTVYYRLKMIDQDGSFEYSKTVAVDLSQGKSQVQASVFPNPYETEFTIELPSSVDANASVQLSDIAGKKLIESTYAVQAGMNMIRVDETCLKPGMYFISIELNGERQTIKLNKQ